jgi:hypothetical protein
MANNDILDMFYNLNERLLTSVLSTPGLQQGLPRYPIQGPQTVYVVYVSTDVDKPS